MEIEEGRYEMVQKKGDWSEEKIALSSLHIQSVCP